MPFKKEGDKIEKYTLTQKPSNDKSGTARWSFAKKDSEPGEFFIKQFLTPKGPSDIATPEENERRKKACKDFYENKKKIYEMLRDVNHPHLLIPDNFFQFENTFYVTYKKLYEEKIEIIFDLELKEKLLVIKSIVEALLEMHTRKIVHADIKPRNIIFEKEEDKVVPFIIDLDSAYIEGEPPDDIIDDFVYKSPEALEYEFDTKDKTKLSCKSDVFSLGLLFYYYLTEHIPTQTISGKPEYASAILLNGGEIELPYPDDISDDVKKLISSMLEYNLKDRYGTRQVYDEILELLGEKSRNITKEMFDSVYESIKKKKEKKAFKRYVKQKDQDSNYFIHVYNDYERTRLLEILNSIEINIDENDVNTFKIVRDLIKTVEKEKQKNNKEVSTLEIKDFLEKPAKFRENEISQQPPISKIIEERDKDGEVSSTLKISKSFKQKKSGYNDNDFFYNPKKDDKMNKEKIERNEKNTIKKTEYRVEDY